MGGDVLSGEFTKKRILTGAQKVTLQLKENKLTEIRNQKVKRAFDLQNAKISVGSGDYEISISTDKQLLTFCALDKNTYHDWMSALRLASKCSFFDTYSVGKKLGEGAHGEVFQCSQHGGDGRQYAVKVVKKENPRLSDIVHNELEIVKSVRHPFLVHTYETHETHFKVYFVMELMSSEVFHELVKRKQFTEDQTRLVLEQVLRALSYLHERDIIHRDIKLENMLLAEEPDFDRNMCAVKISDFGLSTFLDANKGMKLDSDQEPLGTGKYMAPEVLRRAEHTLAADLWSIGVCTYLLLAGRFPFEADTEVGYYKNLLRGAIDFDHPKLEDISPAAKDFMSKLIVVDAEKRLSCQGCLEHEWMKEFVGNRENGKRTVLLNAKRAGTSFLQQMGQRRISDVIKKAGDMRTPTGMRTWNSVRDRRTQTS